MLTSPYEPDPVSDDEVEERRARRRQPGQDSVSDGGRPTSSETPKRCPDVTETPVQANGRKYWIPSQPETLVSTR
jgi:hypothetical protein